MTVRESMIMVLTEALRPEMLEVVDESRLHAGHGGWRQEGETHFRVRVVSEAFRGKSRIERHRMINTLLADALRDGVHALAIEARAGGD